MLQRSITLLLTLCSTAWTHEIGTSRVAAVFEDGRNYRIELVTDAISLMDKLNALSGTAPNTDTTPDHIQKSLIAFDELFRRRVKVAFDDAAVRPSISYEVAPGSGTGAAAVATIKLSGAVPQGAKTFTWNYGWTFASYALTLRNQEASATSTEWLEGGQNSKPFTLHQPVTLVSRWETAARYLALGFTHILPSGLDHMLFVLGIYLLSRKASSVLAQVSAFTIAHSITLGLSMYGFINVSPRIVEPMIAISIAYVSIENLFLSELKSWRIVLVFAFGLLHGMGFAGALRELGLPRSEFLTALLTFNVGVEAGQLCVILAAFLLVGWHYSNRDWYRGRVVVPASVMIACTAVYWTIARIT